MAVSQSSGLSNKTNITVGFTATETGTSTSGNYSNIQVQFTCDSTYAPNWYRGTVDLYVYIDGVLRWGGVDAFSIDKSGTGRWVDLDCGTHTVYHNADGTKTANIRVVTDWGDWGAADMSANYQLTTIPREAKWVTSDGNLTIGNAKDLSWSNDANGYIKLGINVNGSSLATYNRGQTTSYQWNPSSSQISSVYSAMGASGRTATITYTITTYSDSGYTNQIGSSQTLTGTITAPQNYMYAVPYFPSGSINVATTGNSVVKDPDGVTLQTNAWSTLLGNSSVLYGYSDLAGAVVTAATPRYNATISSYQGTIGNNTKTINSTGTFDVFVKPTTNSLTVKAVDSRGDYATLTVNTLYSNDSYVAPVISRCDLARDEEDGTLVTLDLNGTYYGTGRLGGNGSGEANALNVKYRYKTTTSSTWSNWVDITSGCVFSGTGFSYLAPLPTSFNIGEVYSVQVMAYDYVDMTYETQTLPIGAKQRPAHVVNEGVAVFGTFDHDMGGHLQVNGKIHDPIVGEITMYGGEDEVNGWLECDGSAISRSDYRDLFTVIGTTYGSGNGSTTFNIPSLTSANVKYIIKY